MATSLPSRTLVLAAFATVYVVWGSTYLGIRFAVETMPPFTMAGVRFLVAGVALTVVMRARGAAPLTRPQWRAAAVVGALLLLGGNGAVSWAEQRIPSGVAALLVAATPMWMVLLDWARPAGTRPRAAVWLGLALGLAGIVVLVGPSSLGGTPVDPVGALAVTAGSLCWATGSVYQRSAPRAESALLGIGAQMVAGGALLLAFGQLVGEHVDLAAISARSWWALAYLIVAGSLVAYSAYVWLLGVTTPARASTYAYVNPVVAVVLGWALAGEALGPRVLGAAVLVVVAVVLISAAGAARPVAPPVVPADPA